MEDRTRVSEGAVEATRAIEQERTRFLGCGSPSAAALGGWALAGPCLPVLWRVKHPSGAVRIC